VECGSRKPLIGENGPILRVFLALARFENTTVLAPQKRPYTPSRFNFERVNEVTWKLTNGEMTNVPARLGHWCGYSTSKAIAWVIDVGTEKPAWIARHKDSFTNPMHLKEAKSAAIVMAKGECGDYVILDAISHLNGLAARLTDRCS
jgi:hypothetical protein